MSGDEMRRFAWVMAVGLAALGGTPLPAKADGCKLVFIPVELVPNNYGKILLSLKIDDTPAIFALDTGAFWSVIRRDKIGDLTVHSQPVKMMGLGSKKSTGEMVTLPSLSIGEVKLNHMKMFVVPEGVFGDDKVVGAIGANILRAFDIEINLAENKVNFFFRSDCGERLIYWKNDGFAELPFETNEDDEIYVDMKLDGKPIRTVVDTGASQSVLDLSAASYLFDLKPGMPEMEMAGEAHDILGQKLIHYRHQFQKLEMGGLAFNKPWITMAKGNFQRDDDRPGVAYDFLLGVHQLRGLRVVISYGDHKIYLTKASIKVDDSAEEADAPAAPAPAPVMQMDNLDWQLLQPYLERVDAASREGKFDDALAVLDDLLTHYPNYPIVYYDRAQINLKRDDKDAAQADLDHAISLAPRYADAYRLRGTIRRAKHDNDGTNADLDAAIRYEPNSAETFEMRAEQRRQSNDADGALVDATHAIELDPKLPAAYVTRGIVFASRKDFDHSLADFQQASVLNPKNAFAMEGAARSLHHLGRQDEALADSVQAVDLAPNVAQYRNGHCWQLAMMGRFQEALDDCNRGIELAPKWYPVIDSRAYVYLKLHRLKDAVADFDAALAIKPDAAHSMYGRSLAKQEMGDAKGAKADLAAAQQMQPDIAQHFPE